MNKLLLLVTLIGFVFAGCAQQKSEPQPVKTAPAMKGSVHKTTQNGSTIHTYMAPAKAGGGAIHIIEGANKLVIVDAEFVVPFAKEARAYADTLGKPIDRIIISHGHPDHWFGLGAAFADIPSYALAGTKGFIAKKGAGMLEGRRKKMGKLITENFVPITNVLEPGNAVIDGINYQFEAVIDGEAKEQLVVKLPDFGVIIIQDLGFNNIHLFLGHQLIDGWISNLERLQSLTQYNRVLLGHGEPTDTSIYAKNISYLRFAKEAISGSNNGNEFKAKLLAQYPDDRFPQLINIYLPMLYAKGS